MKLIDKDALVAEIDKRMEHLTPHAGQGVILTKVLKDHYEDLRNFINSMKEDPASEDLEEEISKTAEELFDEFFPQDGDLITPSDLRNGIKKVAKHFVNWQKQKMMKNAIESDVRLETPVGDYVYVRCYVKKENLQEHDKVKIIILNEE